MSDATLLRIGIIVAGLILIGAMVLFSRPKKPAQGRRLEPVEREGSPSEVATAVASELEATFPTIDWRKTAAIIMAKEG